MDFGGGTLLDFGVWCFTMTWALGTGEPQELSTGCATVESEVVAEVGLAIPTMQALEDLWKRTGAGTLHAIGVWGFVGNNSQRSVGRPRGGRSAIKGD